MFIYEHCAFCAVNLGGSIGCSISPSVASRNDDDDNANSSFVFNTTNTITATATFTVTQCL